VSVVKEGCVVKEDLVVLSKRVWSCWQRGLYCRRGFGRVGREGLDAVLFTHMAARDSIRSERKYEPHVLLDAEYIPLIKKGIGFHLQCSISEFPCKRLLG
jgi:hypothetical protein